MKRFYKIYKQYIVEQDNDAAIAAPETVAPAIGNQQPGAIPPAAAGPESDTNKLDSAAFVGLIRMLKSAFVARPSDEDTAKITTDIGEINETNAMDVYKKLIPVIGKYVDIRGTLGGDLNLDKIK